MSKVANSRAGTPRPTARVGAAATLLLRPSLIIGLAMVLVVTVGCVPSAQEEVSPQPQPGLQSRTPPAAGAQPLAEARVTRIIDGDTIEVQPLGGAQLPSTRVRLIGVNAPELHGDPEPLGREAAAFTERQLAGATVWLEKDVSDTDRYGRALRYVWLAPAPAQPTEADLREKLFNAWLVLEGYANTATVPPDVKYAEWFRRFEREARQAGRGLWAVEDPSSDSPAPPGEARDYDCSDFGHWRDAQDFYLATGGPQRDPHRLDGDGDGVACENLPGAPARS